MKTFEYYIKFIKDTTFYACKTLKIRNYQWEMDAISYKLSLKFYVLNFWIIITIIIVVKKLIKHFKNNTELPQIFFQHNFT